MSSILKAARDSSSLSPCRINRDQSIDISVPHLVELFSFRQIALLWFEMPRVTDSAFFNIVQKAFHRSSPLCFEHLVNLFSFPELLPCKHTSCICPLAALPIMWQSDIWAAEGFLPQPYVPALLLFCDISSSLWPPSIDCMYSPPLASPLCDNHLFNNSKGTSYPPQA